MDKEIQKKVSSDVIDCLDNLSIADQMDVIAVVYASLAKAAYQMFDEDGITYHDHRVSAAYARTMTPLPF